MIKNLKNNKILSQEMIDELQKIRMYGNRYNHPEEPDQPSRIASNSEFTKIIKKLHSVMANYFQNHHNVKGNLSFDTNRLLIENYKPIRKLDIKNYEEGCENKYLCVKELENEKSYYIIREFRRKDPKAPKETHFMIRDSITLQRLSDEDLVHIVKNHNIYIEDNNELFFTCYELSDKDINLMEENLNTASVEERLNIVHQTAKGLEGIHHAEEPVYHRALTPSSIYLKVKRSGRKTVRIGNFEYSKLEEVNGVTMVSKVFNRRKDLFRAPEVEKGSDNIDWSKVDVYSFGMIILYIFNIRDVNPHFHLNKLKKFNLSEEFIDTIDAMVDTHPSFRPNMKDVLEDIEKEVDLIGKH